MDLDNNKVEVDWFYLKKIVIGTVRGNQFLYIYIYIYILLEVGYKYSSDCYSVSFLILQSPSLRASLLFYTVFPLSSLPSICKSDITIVQISLPH